MDTKALKTQLTKKTVVTLKEECDKYGLSKAGKKTDLILRLVTHLKSKSSSNGAAEDTENVENAKSVVAPSKAKKPAPLRRGRSAALELSVSSSSSSASASSSASSSSAEDSSDDDEDREPEISRKKMQKVEGEEDDEEENEGDDQILIPKTSSQAFETRLRLIDNRSWRAGVSEVLKQVHPILTMTLSGFEFLKKFIVTICDQILHHIAKTSTSELNKLSLGSAIGMVLNGDLSKHCYLEATRAAQVWSDYLSSSDIDKRTGLVFHYNIFENYVKVGFGIRIADPFALAMFSAVGEYLVAELLEGAGNLANEEAAGGIGGLLLRNAAFFDDEFRPFLEKIPAPSAKSETQALGSWENNLQKLLTNVKALPMEECESIIDRIQRELRLEKATISLRDMINLQVDALPEKAAREYLKIPPMVKYHEFKYHNEPNLEMRSLNSSFNMTTKNGVAFFEYYNFAFAAHSKKKLSVEIPSKGFSAAVWQADTEKGGYSLIYNTTNQLKEFLEIDLPDKEFVQALLCICESDGSGDLSGVNNELELMSTNILFDF